jgi:cation transport ATPase
MTVAGIECAFCARRLVAHLRGLPGVESAIANPRTGWLRVRLRPGEISENNLRVEVRRAGFVPGGSSARLRAAGLHCPACARSLEQTLRAMPGVEHVAVEFTTGQVRVDYLSDQTGPEAFVAAAAREGFRLEAWEPEPFPADDLRAGAVAAAAGGGRTPRDGPRGVDETSGQARPHEPTQED